MFTSKQRSNLKALAANISPVTQIGKGGVSENLIKSLSESLESREIIKVTFLDNASGEIKEVAEGIADKLNAEVVACIGRKIILYRKSSKKDFKHIEF